MVWQTGEHVHSVADQRKHVLQLVVGICAHASQVVREMRTASCVKAGHKRSLAPEGETRSAMRVFGMSSGSGDRGKTQSVSLSVAMVDVICQGRRKLQSRTVGLGGRVFVFGFSSVGNREIECKRDSSPLFVSSLVIARYA